MLKEIAVNEERILVFAVTGKLTHRDCRDLLVRLNALPKEPGARSLLLDLEAFKGWEAEAAWDTLSLGVAHLKDFERIAIIGDKGWKGWMMHLARLLLAGQSRYFQHDQAKEVWEWLRKEPPKPAQGFPRKYRHILLATDLSEATRQAGIQAREIAKQYGAKLTVLHVMEALPVDDDLLEPTTMPYQLEFEAQWTQNAVQKLTQLSEQLDYPGTATKVLNGSPVSTIVSYAEEHDVGLILLAHGSHSGLERLLGSITAKVVKHASCDVLSLRV
ncbi:MAG: universal stress protein [Pseudomonadota bacterium]